MKILFEKARLQTVIFFTFFLIILFFDRVGGQNITYIEGRVIDSVNARAVYGVNIYSGGNKIIGQTDKNGQFKIPLHIVKGNLLFSYLGYEKFSLQIDNHTAGKYFEVRLVPSYNELKEVDISASKSKIFYNNKTEDVLDYEFFMDGILLLVNDLHYKTALLFENSQKDTIAFLPAPASLKLYRDCSGNDFLLTDKGARQITYENHKLELLALISKKIFVEEIAPCVQEGKNNYYYEQSTYHGYINSCYFSRKDTIIFHPICEIYDNRKINLYKSERKVIGKMAAISPDYIVDAEEKFAEHVLCRAVYNPLFLVNDTALIFNHFTGNIEKFDINGKALGSVPIEYHKDKNWLEKLVKDDVSGKVYALCHHGSHYILRNIDITTGLLKEGISIDYPFPENIKVRNGIVYFLYKQAEDKNVSLIRFTSNN